MTPKKERDVYEEISNVPGTLENSPKHLKMYQDRKVESMIGSFCQ